MSPLMKQMMKPAIALGLLAAATPAFAHPGFGPETFGTGLVHPLTGFDHLLMLSGAGVMAALNQRPRRFIFAVLLAMFGSAIAGHLTGAFIGMETLIALSMFAAGSLILLARGNMAKASWVLPVLALAHGWAHGVEGNADGFWLFVVGFMISSSAILAAGFALGSLLRRHPAIRKWCGGGWIAAALMVVLGG